MKWNDQQNKTWRIWKIISMLSKERLDFFWKKYKPRAQKFIVALNWTLGLPSPGHAAFPPPAPWIWYCFKLMALILILYVWWKREREICPLKNRVHNRPVYESGETGALHQIPLITVITEQIVQKAQKISWLEIIAKYGRPASQWPLLYQGLLRY